VDCGADIGLMTSRLISECPNITRAIAFEPNPTSYPFLNNNMQHLKIQAEAKNKAISDFTGTAELHYPDFDSHDHAAFIVPSKTGTINVCSIDDLGLPLGSSILLKIDVEGEEYSVIRGAAKTLSRVKHFVVIFEAHHKQVQRTKIDPITLITYLRKLRPCKSTVVEVTDSEIDLNRPFFEQFVTGIYNICVYST
jgi:FkbM family methyltransferase